MSCAFFRPILQVGINAAATDLKYHVLATVGAHIFNFATKRGHARLNEQRQAGSLSHGLPLPAQEFPVVCRSHRFDDGGIVKSGKFLHAIQQGFHSHCVTGNHAIRLVACQDPEDVFNKWPRIRCVYHDGAKLRPSHRLHQAVRATTPYGQVVERNCRSCRRFRLHKSSE